MTTYDETPHTVHLSVEGASSYLAACKVATFAKRRHLETSDTLDHTERDCNARTACADRVAADRKPGTYHFVVMYWTRGDAPDPLAAYKAKAGTKA